MVEFALDSGAKIPGRSHVGYLDKDIAGEGQSANGFTLSDGEAIKIVPSIVNPTVPDLSQHKSLAKYFNRSGFAPYPAWIYHPSEEPVLVHNADEAMEHGVFYRETTQAERMRGMTNATWDWSPTTEWRPMPYAKRRAYDPDRPEGGKAFEYPRPDYQQAQHDMLKALVTGLGAVKEGPASGISADTLAAALVKAMTTIAQNAAPPPPVPPAPAESLPADVAWDDKADAPPIDEVDLLHKEAERLGMKIDKRWGVDRLRAEISDFVSEVGNVPAR